MRTARVPIRLSGSFRALRRGAAVVVSVLLAHQTIAPAWVACEGVGALHAVAGAGSVAHDHHGSALGAQTPVKAPKPSGSCEDTELGSSCCVAAGCTLAVPVMGSFAVALQPVRPRPIAVPSENFLSQDAAPEVPPPRA